MSKIGKMLIEAIKEAKEKGLVTLQTSPPHSFAQKLKTFSKRVFSTYHK